jgi:hypothetical protein
MFLATKIKYLCYYEETNGFYVLGVTSRGLGLLCEINSDGRHM